MHYYLFFITQSINMESVFVRSDVFNAHSPSTTQLMIGEESLHMNFSSSVKRRKFLTRTFSFSSTTYHTLPSLTKRYGPPYVLSKIRVNCIQIMTHKYRRHTTTRRRIPSLHALLLNDLPTCVVEPKYLQYSSKVNIRRFLRFLSKGKWFLTATSA